MLDTINRAGTDELVRLAQLVQATGYRFTTTTPATHARVNARPNAAWAHDLPGVFGWSRPFRDGAVPPEIFAALQAADMLDPGPAAASWRSRVRFSTLDGLLFAHSAFPTATADAVFFGPDTYRFAQAIAGVLDRPVRRAVDIGCGSGAGAVLVARAHPAAKIVAIDINPEALRLTAVNAALAGVAVRPCQSDLLQAVAGQFDLIIANPPYLVDPAARAYRHGGGPLGAGLSLKIIDAAPDRLAPGGTLLLYTGAAIVDGHDAFAEAVAQRLASTRLAWRYREVDPDVFAEELDAGAYMGADRIAAIVLTATNP